MTFYTVGYEGLDIQDFVALLKKNKIRKLIDIRKNPVSRKKGFSKSRLNEALLAAGIEYHHFGSLGVPTEWRKKQKAELITRKKMFSDYVKKILPKEEDTINQVIRLGKARGRAALLCYEEDPLDCHRSLLLEKVQAQHKAKVVHIRRPQKLERSLMRP